MQKLLVFALVAASFGCSAASPAQLEPSCRREIITLCGLTRDREAIRSCLKEKYRALSKPCVETLQKLRRDKEQNIVRAAGGTEYSYGRDKEQNIVRAAGGTEYSYGRDKEQVLDFYPAPGGTNAAPLIIFIHGGGWSIGDKAMGVGAKAGHFTGLGYAFASLNYRLVPATDPAGQTADIAQALAWLRARAARLGFDPDRIILMGHSAGAHLAALVSSDPAYLDAASVPFAAVRGTILLDGAGYDVATQMAAAGPIIGRMYKEAFSTDREKQLQLSPLTHAGSPNVARWLILFDAGRADSGPQSTRLATALQDAGADATAVAIQDSSHMKINRELGMAGDRATELVDAFVRAAL